LDALRRTALIAALIFALAGGWGWPALAQEAGETAAEATDEAAADHGEAGGEGAAEEHAGEDHGGGMPQLDASSYPSQIFWLIISFSVLYWLLSRKALPRVAEILETRQERIAADLDRAAQLRREAEQAYEEYQRIVAEAQSRAQAQLRQTREKMTEDFSRRQAEHDAELAKKVRDAEARIDEARQQALAAIDDVAIEAAQAATQRLIGIDVGADRARAALSEVKEAA